VTTAAAVLLGVFVHTADSTTMSDHGLWSVYDQSLENAKYIDLTHILTLSIPVWKGFGPAKFGPTVNPDTGKPYQYEKDGFEATQYFLSTDQYGTQLDPPAHWAPEAPLPKSDKILHWDKEKGMRVRE